MNRIVILLVGALCALLSLKVSAQQGGKPQLNEDYTFNENTTEPRPLHYRPEGQSVVVVDGTARYNRALYGVHTGFRVECSDQPVFGIYLPGMGGHLDIELPEGPCTARYEAGGMRYEQGGILLEVEVARTGADCAFWRMRNTTDQQQAIGITFGGVSGLKFYRNGDLGVDDPTAFDLKPEYCTSNRMHIEGEHVRIAYLFKEEERWVSLTLPLDSIACSTLPHLIGYIHLAPDEERVIAYRPYQAEPLTPRGNSPSDARGNHNSSADRLIAPDRDPRSLDHPHWRSVSHCG